MEESLNIILYTLAILLFFSAGILFIKAHKKKELTLFTSAVARVFGGISLLIYLSQKESILYLMLAVLFITTSDIINSILWFINQKYKRKEDNRVLLNVIEQINKKFLSFFENSLVGFYIFDENGKFEFVNDKIAEITGYTKKELLNMTIFNLICEEDHLKVRQNIYKRLSGEVKSIEYEICFVTKDSRRLKARVLGTATTNGHQTISGTVIPI